MICLASLAYRFNLFSGKVLVRVITGFTIMFLCSGCGTHKVLSADQNRVLSPVHRNSKTNCDSVPRVYGGISYNLCLSIFSDRVGGASFNSLESSWYLVDSTLSLIADTLVLPYSIYAQCNSGNVPFLEAD